MSRVMGRLEVLYVIPMFALLTNAFVSVIFLPDSGDGIQENKVLQYILIAMYFFMVVDMIRRNLFLRLISDAGTPAFLLSILAIVSSMWSFNPAFVFQKSIALTLTTIFGAYLAYSYSIQEFCRIFGIALTFVVVSSAIFIVFLPGFGIDQGDVHTGTWRGVFPQKQVFAQVLVFYMTFLFVFKNGFTKYWRWLVLSSLICLFFTRSATAMIALVFMFLILLLMRLKDRLDRRVLPILILPLFLLLSVFLLEGMVYIFDALGKDVTLSGRTFLWDIAWESIKEKPILGYGFSAYWHEFSDRIFIYLGYYAVNAHFSLIDIVLDFGFVGLVFLVSLFSLVMKFAYAKIDIDEYKFVFLFFMMVLFFSTAASIFPNPNNYVWVFIVASYFYLRDVKYVE